MVAYQELIKNFENIRGYMNEFFIYGFRTRDEYQDKSSRSYDNERRRIKSYLGDLVTFAQNENGRNVFISLDGSEMTRNPLYKAFRSKSFTAKDITLHFTLLDILSDGRCHTLREIIDTIDTIYLDDFEEPVFFDESTLRKKLNEYAEIGIVKIIKKGRCVSYQISEDNIRLADYNDAVRFFAEINPLGVVGSYIRDRLDDVCRDSYDIFSFKNNYLMNAYDSEIIELIFEGIHEKRIMELVNVNMSKSETEWKVIPLKLYISTDGGRNYLFAKDIEYGQVRAFRVDYIRKIKLGDYAVDYNEISEQFEKMREHIWGVSCQNKKTEHIEMDIHVAEHEDYIVNRIYREKRCGTVTKINDNTYRFEADVYDSIEMLPWIRTFFGRIEDIKCDNKFVIDTLIKDLIEMSN